MPELQTPEGATIAAPAAEGETQFARSMAAPPASDSDAAAPPPRPDAPYGYKPDGTPKKAAGRPRRGAKGDPADRARTTAAAGVSRETGAHTLGPDDAGRIRTGILGYGQIGASLTAAGTRLAKTEQGKIALTADSLTIVQIAPEFAEACVTTAAADAGFAALMAKVCALGPWAALLEVSSKLGMQLTRNHRPALQLPGTRDPADIVAELELELAEASEGQAEAEPAAA
jgi:hypothetical protein